MPTDYDAKERIRKQDALNKCRDELAAQGFDAVVIVATHMDENGGTILQTSQAGNWYTQSGMLQYMATMRLADASLEAQRRRQHEEDD